MSFLEIGGHRHALPVGESVIGSDESSLVSLAVEGVLPRHAILHAHPNGEVHLKRAEEAAEVLVNGVRLGPNPTPLLHGDKVTVGGQEIGFVDEQKSGSTQYVQAIDPATLAGMMKPGSKKRSPRHHRLGDPRHIDLPRVGSAWGQGGHQLVGTARQPALGR